MAATRSMPVPEGLSGMRVDAAVARMLGLSRTVVEQMISTGGVVLDGTPVTKSDRVSADAWLEITMPEPPRDLMAGMTPVDGLRIVHDDDDLVVVDKPVGVAAHPSPGWEGPTVIGGLMSMGYRISTSGAPERQGVVHRLDVGTSGLMVVAKSEHAYSVVKQAFRDRTVDKRYRALVQGHPDPSAGTIDAPIDRHPQHDYKFAVVAGGRESVTHYVTLEAFRAASLLEVHLETGRTHQIRVHFAAVRHPCAGDLTYGADPVLARELGLTRQWLHAARLGLTHPATGEWVEWSSPDPADLDDALTKLRDVS